MIDMHEETTPLESTTVKVMRTAATIKGGRRFSFGALVVVGDRSGRVGIGYGKANEVPPAIEKGEKEARRSLKSVHLKEGTIPHTVIGRAGASRVKMVPASPGTGVIAGGTVRAVLDLVGVRDCLTKAYGSTNQMNLVKATLDGLLQLRRKDQVEALRGVEIEETHVEEILKRGADFAPVSVATSPRTEPVAGRPDSANRGKGRGGGGQRRSSRRSSSRPEKAEAPAPAPAPAPAAEAAAPPTPAKEAQPAAAPAPQQTPPADAPAPSESASDAKPAE